jgi:cytochrome c556
MKSLAFLPLAGLVAFATLSIAQDAPVVDPAIAGMTVDQLVDARQAAMKEDGMLLRESGGATAERRVEIATHILQNFTNFPALFREGSINDKSEALPVIWEQWDAFSALLAKGQGYATELLAAANAGDDAAWGATLKNFGGLCGECHREYRKPM